MKDKPIKNTPSRKPYEKTNQDEEINIILDKINDDYNNSTNKEFYKKLIDSYNYYYLYSDKLNEYEKNVFLKEKYQTLVDLIFLLIYIMKSIKRKIYMNQIMYFHHTYLKK